MAEERLHKILAQAGVASRRRAEELILEGRVQVNGRVVKTLGVKADPEKDNILVDHRPVRPESRIYLALNKPRGYISDRDETGEHKSALDLAPGGERLFAVGRLDLNSEGLLLLTNDGDLTFRLTHPRYEHEKEYLALVAGRPDAESLKSLVKGVIYQGERLTADQAAPADRKQPWGEAGRDETWVRIVLHEGKKREIRHLCAAIGHPVLRLLRVRIGPVKLGMLKAGRTRPLSQSEIQALRESSQLPARPRPRQARAAPRFKKQHDSIHHRD